MNITPYNPISFKGRVNQYSKPNNHNSQISPQQNNSKSIQMLNPACTAGKSMVRFSGIDKKLTKRLKNSDVIEIMPSDSPSSDLFIFTSSHQTPEDFLEEYKQLLEKAKNGDCKLLRFDTNAFKDIFDPTIIKLNNVIRSLMRELKLVQEIKLLKNNPLPPSSLPPPPYWYTDKGQTIVMNSGYVEQTTAKNIKADLRNLVATRVKETNPKIEDASRSLESTKTESDSSKPMTKKRKLSNEPDYVDNSTDIPGKVEIFRFSHLQPEDSEINKNLVPLLRKAGYEEKDNIIKAAKLLRDMRNQERYSETNVDKFRLQIKGYRPMSDSLAKKIARLLNKKLEREIKAEEIISWRDKDIETIELLKANKVYLRKEVRAQTEQPEAGPSTS